MLDSRWDDGVPWHTTLVTEPTAEPLDLAEAKLQVRRQSVTDDDEYLAGICIPAVRDRAEGVTGRQLITATWDLVLDRFPCARYIEVPKPPLQSVTSVSYVDEDGATQTLSSALYTVQAPAGPRCARGRIILNYDESWPTIRFQPGAVTVRFVAGYGSSSAKVPPRLKQGMLLDLGTLYEHREDHVVGQGYAVTPFPLGAASIYQSFRSWSRG